MGSVADLYTTGDNDPEIEPEQYYRHYLYCDTCGSFELDGWLAPENHEGIENTRRRLWRAAVIAAVVVALTGFLADEIPLPSWLFLAGLIVLVGLLVTRAVLGSKIELVGMRCRQCGATYKNGTPFFTDLDANPRKLTIDVVPRPLGSSPFSRGKFVA